MKTNIFLLVVCVLLYVHSVFPAPPDSEKVWLKDVTTSFETDKRTAIDLDLPDELTFHLSRGSNYVTLHLKRNHWIDPNTDVYVVRKLKNGKPHLEKTENLEKEDLAYYLDKGNGAFLTVRCVRRSNGQCDRVINGNIRIGDRNFDIRPAGTDIVSRNVFGVPDVLGTEYVLRDQANMPRDISIERNTDAVNVDMRKVEQPNIDLQGRVPPEQYKRDDSLQTIDTILSTKIELFHNEGIIGKGNKDTYWIEVTVLIDSTIWDLFESMVQVHGAHRKFSYVKEKLAIRHIREYYSHIFNGVHLAYNEIEDDSLDISVTLRKFHIFKNVGDISFQGLHMVAKDGKTYVDANKYLNDICQWDELTGYDPHHDHTMLFTRHDLFNGSMEDKDIHGLAKDFGICIPSMRVSLVHGNGYFHTVRTAAHELGHNIGADHDGDGLSTECPSEDLFIMSPDVPLFDQNQPYSKNPRMFSKCSVRTFKKALKDRDCLTNPGIFFNKEKWNKFTMKLPGERYTPNEQCHFINGPTSAFCGAVSEKTCLYMQCKDPKTGKCDPIPVLAHDGTRCGTKKWCKKGKCVLQKTK